MLAIDLHTHTIASGHAFNTLFEMVAEAERRGVRMLGVTEHGPSMEGAPHLWFFNMAQRVPGNLRGVNIVCGVEANILDEHGRLDIPDSIAAVQDIVIAGLHEFTPYNPSADAKANTLAILGAMCNPHVDVVAHAYRPEFPVEVEPIVEAAAERQVLLEVNLSLLKRRNLDPVTLAAYRRLIELARRYRQPLVVNSDAHIATDLGDDSCLADLDLGLTPADYWHPGYKSFRLTRRLSTSAKDSLAAVPRNWPGHAGNAIPGEGS